MFRALLQSLHKATSRGATGILLITVCLSTLLIKEPYRAEPIEEGFSSTVWKITTDSGQQYILRSVPESDDQAFKTEVSIINQVAEQGLGPALLGVDFSKKEMLLEYISCVKWPEYSSDSEPYQKVMRALRKVHRLLPVQECNHYEPFTFIRSTSRELIDEVEWLPDQFHEAVEQIESFYSEIFPWLKKYIVICHADLHKKNVLNTEDHVYLIDWTTATEGHPFFDIAKFTMGMKSSDKLSMLENYLGHCPDAEERKQFTVIDLALLVVVAANRFLLATKSTTNPSDLYRKEELEEKLRSGNLLSYLEVNFKDTSPKARQLGAIRALHEFAKRLHREKTLSHILQRPLRER